MLPRQVQALLSQPVRIAVPGQHQFVYRPMYVQAPPGQEVPSVVAASPNTGLSCNMKYIITVPGILKIIEFVSKVRVQIIFGV